MAFVRLLPDDAHLDPHWARHLPPPGLFGVLLFGVSILLLLVRG